MSLTELLLLDLATQNQPDRSKPLLGILAGIILFTMFILWI